MESVIHLAVPMILNLLSWNSKKSDVVVGMRTMGEEIKGEGFFA